MKNLAVVIFFLMLFKVLDAQVVPGNIRGRVLAESKMPLEGVTVSVFTSGTQPFLKILTDSNGFFSFPRPAVSFFLVASHIGYIPYKITAFESDSIAVVLKSAGNQLAEVQITSSRPFIEQQMDKMVVNVDGNPKAGINVVDILKKIPGIILRNEEEIAVEGMPVTILIDGKQTRLTGSSLLSLLNGMPAANISQMEIIYNPSAKYDAQGAGGIINIRTLKRQKPGYDVNLNLTAGQGWKYPNGSSAVGINYKTGKSNWYLTYSLGAGKQYQEIQTNTIQTDLNQKLLDSSVYRTKYLNHNMRLGLDQSLNKNDVLGFLVTAYYNNRDPNFSSETGSFNLNDLRQNAIVSSGLTSNSIGKGVNLNVNYKHVIDVKQQKELSFDIDGGAFDYLNDSQTSLLKKSLKNTDPLIGQRLMQEGKTGSEIYSFKSDYAQKTRKGNIEAGVKASYVNIDNDFNSVTDNDQLITDNGSNRFLYKETILAAYGNSRIILGKFSFQLGLRAEQTFTNGYSVTLDDRVKRSYLNLFPNITAALKMKGNAFSLSYSRRIGRPAYNFLNPFEVVRSAYVISKGNPYLNPSYTDNYRLSYTLNNKLSMSVTYADAKDIITDLKTREDQSEVTSSFKSNLGSFTNTGFNAAYSDKVFKFLQINYGFGLSNSSYGFLYHNVFEKVKQNTGYISLGNSFQISKTAWAEVFFYGQSRVTYGNQVNLPFSTTSISAGKKIFNGNGNLSLNVNDIFFTGLTRSEANYGNVVYNLKSRYDSRSVRLNFSYRFGNSKIDSKKRSSGSDDEQKRTSVSSN